MKDRTAQEERGATIALCVVAMAAFWLHAHFIVRVPVDDAGISVAYARSVAEGAGFRVTPESAVAEGFSNPTWTLLLVGLELLGFDSLTWVRPLGMAFAALALPVLMLWGPLAERRKLQIEDALGPLVAATHPSFVHWAQGGLEMGVQVFGIALLGACALGPQTLRRALLFGASAALVVLTRPEGGLYALAAGAAWPMVMLAERRKPGKMELYAVLVSVLPVASYLAFRRLYFGEWLPNTYFAKQHWTFMNAVTYLQGYWDTYRPLMVTTSWCLPFALVGGWATTRRALTCALLLAAIVYFTHRAHGDWMMEWRFLAVSAPFVGAAIGAGISGGRSGLLRAAGSFDRFRAGAARMTGALAVLLTSAMVYKLLPTALARSEQVRAQGYDVPIDIKRGAPFMLAEQMLAPFKMAHPFVLASDMGAIALGMRKAELWDFAGLTDPAISHYFRRPASLEDYFLNEGPPSLVLAWGPGNYFPGSKLSQSYDEIDGNKFIYKGLTAEQDPRCPDGKAATLAMSVPALVEQLEKGIREREPRVVLARWRCAHTYRSDRNLPTVSERSRIAKMANQLGVESHATKKAELALRYYSLCATIGIKDTFLTVQCRKRAERIRARLFRK